jgi:hypothetical protein
VKIGAAFSSLTKGQQRSKHLYNQTGGRCGFFFFARAAGNFDDFVNSNDIVRKADNIALQLMVGGSDDTISDIADIDDLYPPLTTEVSEPSR